MQIEHIKPARSGKPAGHLRRTLVRDFKMNKWKYLIILPVIVYFAIFAYKPMYGVIIAFKNYRPSLGILDSPWVGLLQFKLFFRDIYFWRLLRNTFCISGLSILFGFPAPIILAPVSYTHLDVYKRQAQHKGHGFPCFSPLLFPLRLWCGSPWFWRFILGIWIKFVVV